MVIAFYNPISEDFYNKLNDSCTLDEKIDVFVENIHEFLCPFFMLFRSNRKKKGWIRHIFPKGVGNMERTNTTTEQSYDFSEYSIMSKEDFEKLILMNLSKTTYQLTTLNTLHNIVTSGGYYCYCGDIDKCKMCTIPIIFE